MKNTFKCSLVYCGVCISFSILIMTVALILGFVAHSFAIDHEYISKSALYLGILFGFFSPKICYKLVSFFIKLVDKL